MTKLLIAIAALMLTGSGNAMAADNGNGLKPVLVLCDEGPAPSVSYEQRGAPGAPQVSGTIIYRSLDDKVPSISARDTRRG